MFSSTDIGPDGQAPLLALDTASPTVSVAVVAFGQDASGRDASGRDAGGEALAQRSLAQRHSSAVLLRLVDEVLRDSDLRLDLLGGLVAVRGPGSFTGLRVGLATVLGLHQATGLPAMALSALEVLAATIEEPGDGPVLAVVDARRGDYFVQRFAGSAELRPLEPPRRAPAAELSSLDMTTVVGHDLAPLRHLPGWPSGTVWHEPGPLAATAARLAVRRPGGWSAEQLTRPLYLEAPAVSPPAS